MLNEYSCQMTHIALRSRRLHAHTQLVSQGLLEPRVFVTLILMTLITVHDIEELTSQKTVWSLFI